MGEIGVMGDTPALLNSLRDEDWVSRELAENVLWQVWSCSGDDQIDALYQQ